MSWRMELTCNCIIETVIGGIAQVSMFDGIDGLNVECPRHGWQLQVNSKDTRRALPWRERWRRRRVG